MGTSKPARMGNLSDGGSSSVPDWLYMKIVKNTHLSTGILRRVILKYKMTLQCHAME